MSAFSFIDICDAIATDLTTLAETAAPGGYTDWRYASPDMLNTDNLPAWLAVYSIDTRHELLSTIGDYQDDDDIEIQWATSISDSVELGGVGEPGTVSAAAHSQIAILNRLRTYSQGLPSPFNNQVVGTLIKTERSTEKALVWAQTTTLRVTNLGAE